MKIKEEEEENRGLGSWRVGRNDRLSKDQEVKDEGRIFFWKIRERSVKKWDLENWRVGRNDRLSKDQEVRDGRRKTFWKIFFGRSVKDL